ncbi:transglycosylase domain-containing protein [Streptomyces sp. NPDC051909]|uniref:transglycosylase domain-containing protein n=1 Tax=Streptomyces sp. NPDC051909 TaxID=3154944 RepID=UPI00344693B8
MSEHRRKPPQPQQQQPPYGGRAAARRAAQPPMGRRPAPGRDAATGSPSASYGPPSSYGEEERPYGGRAEARRAAQRGGRRRAPEGGGGPGGPGGRRGGGGGGRGDGPGRGHGGAGGRPPGKKRIIDYPRYGKYGWRRWMPSWKLVTGLFLAFVGGLMGAATIAYARVDIPNEAISAKQQNNVYYWSDGSVMATTGEVNRQIIGYEEIPVAMKDAVVSAENKTFWTDSGIDPMGIGRAVWNMAKGEQTQGGSTITQQYVKNNRLDDQSQTVTRKVKELFISMRVGNELEKSEIMAGYLNTSYYGRGAYGLQAASRAYFGKEASKLNPSECALLASVLKGATYYDPAGYPEIDPNANAQANTDRARKRWSWILDEMVKDKKLDATERAKYAEMPKTKPRTSGAQLGGQIGYLVRTAEANFLNNTEVTTQQLAKGGYEIHTTFDKKKVKALESAVKKVYDEHIDPKKRPDTDTHVQFGGASVNPETGAIVAIYGGENATKHFTNNADQTGAQVGSTFKPFVLAAAMRDGVRDPKGEKVQGPETRTIVDPNKSVYNGTNKLTIKNYDGSTWYDDKGNEWRQKNDEGASLPKVNLRTAMMKSLNSPYVQLGMDVGIDKVRQSAIDAGLLDSSLVKANVPSFSLGISSPSAIRMAGAYATFANNGERNDVFSVTKVLKEGGVVYEHKAEPKRAFTTAVASNVTDVLKDVVKKGTGTKAALDDREAAGKTGTTDGNNSAWFVGYTPQLSTAIDMYRFADDETLKDRKFESMFGTGAQPKIHGSSFPSQIWHDYMTDALKGTDPKSFPAPEDLDGEAVFGGGAVSPTPTPTETTQSPTPSMTPSTEAPTGKPTRSPDPGKTCSVWDWPCKDNGGTSTGADSGGTTGGTTSTPTVDPTSTATTDPTSGGGGGKPGGTSWGVSG